MTVDYPDTGVAVVRLSSPDTRNALTREIKTTLRDALAEVADDDAVRAVVLTMSGKPSPSARICASTPRASDGPRDSARHAFAGIGLGDQLDEHATALATRHAAGRPERSPRSRGLSRSASSPRSRTSSSTMQPPRPDSG
ncbi:MAG TPA: enoyl-CoA hydratase-related protein [Actinomycetospora sp.]|uniref:enoyl-CoA hydratase/isomerase family protein n=1 Tax=Actinomycetospora sp. TaxID=1872135 RepID=UPI002F3E7AF1